MRDVTTLDLRGGTYKAVQLMQDRNDIKLLRLGDRRVRVVEWGNDAFTKAPFFGVLYPYCVVACTAMLNNLSVHSNVPLKQTGLRTSGESYQQPAHPMRCQPDG